jgi:hypothetical protein
MPATSAASTRISFCVIILQQSAQNSSSPPAKGVIGKGNVQWRIPPSRRNSSAFEVQLRTNKPNRLWVEFCCVFNAAVGSPTSETVGSQSLSLHQFYNFKVSWQGKAESD